MQPKQYQRGSKWTWPQVNEMQWVLLNQRFTCGRQSTVVIPHLSFFSALYKVWQVTHIPPPRHHNDIKRSRFTSRIYTSGAMFIAVHFSCRLCTNADTLNYGHRFQIQVRRHGTHLRSLIRGLSTDNESIISLYSILCTRENRMFLIGSMIVNVTLIQSMVGRTSWKWLLYLSLYQSYLI